ncbi:MAG: SRPBCC family protein [Pseudonocardia sp.]
MTEPDPTARVVRVQAEVPGTPEQAWQAIATGPGITAWFAPAEVEERAGGAITTHHGPFGDSTGTVTVWEPPRRFVYEERDWNPDAPDAPVWATEILVQAREGGTCVVRLASGFFHGGADWEDELGGTHEGWARGMVNLRLHLTHFPGQPAGVVFVAGRVPVKRADAAGTLLGGLGLAGVVVGEQVRAPAGAPPFAGVVEEVGEGGVLVRTPEGLLELDVWEMLGAMATVRAYLYGAAAATAETQQRRWARWLRATFPDLTPPS